MASCLIIDGTPFILEFPLHHLLFFHS
jgi:hypothetical protein